MFAKGAGQLSRNTVRRRSSALRQVVEGTLGDFGKRAASKESGSFNHEKDGGQLPEPFRNSLARD